jgi:RNA polymerase sigma-70 factor (ECF subfamily)
MRYGWRRALAAANQMDENELIQFAKTGDLTAFNRLVLDYQDLAYNVAFRIMGDHASAEDAVQEGVIKAFKNLKRFRGGSFKAWLLRIVTNTCYDELRRRKRRPTTPLEPLTDDNKEMENPKWLADPSESPEEFAMREELSRAIQDCLGGLTEDFRTIVVLVDIQGMDYAEAAEVASTPLGTVKSRLARARRNLRDCLQGFGELLPAAFR